MIVIKWNLVWAAESAQVTDLSVQFLNFAMLENTTFMVHLRVSLCPVIADSQRRSTVLLTVHGQLLTHYRYQLILSHDQLILNQYQPLLIAQLLMSILKLMVPGEDCRTTYSVTTGIAAVRRVISPPWLPPSDGGMMVSAKDCE